MAPRPRVLSFLSQWGGGPPQTSVPPPPDTSSSPSSPKLDSPPSTPPREYPRHGQPETIAPDYNPRESFDKAGVAVSSVPVNPTQGSGGAHRTHSRRSSMVFTYQPPTMEIARDTPAELQPIFTYLNGHANKLFQEGYFLKLHDLDSRGRPSTDRVWVECFAQLVGTVLSLWDAAQLDAAGDDGEVVPTFINLTDASIKMIESLPMNGVDGQNLQNVLSISTAANNRYLLHFNSLHSLTQWTAGIRLAMYEHVTLQEAYTGSILAGKGKYLNGIRTIMERARFPMEDWARVRFGAGTPWRRCWCVINPPGEKEYQKAQKEHKKRSAYDRSAPIVKGDIKFYDTKKVTKKTQPIATVTEAFAAYAIYPQAKELIDQSTLVKVEGKITIHTGQDSTTEGFIFVMPEVHAAVSGFEIMLRWLMPVFDTFGLYGRPTRLIADSVDPQSLMFAMPTSKRYGYLELIDVAGLIHSENSRNWGERDWRKQMKLLTSKRMTGGAIPGRQETSVSQRNSQSSSNLPSQTSRSSLNLPSKRAIAFGDDHAVKSSPGSRQGSPKRGENGGYRTPPRTNSGPENNPYQSPQHKRAASDMHRRSRPTEGSRLSFETPQDDRGPPPPPHGPAQPGHPQFMRSHSAQQVGWPDARESWNSADNMTPDREQFGNGYRGQMGPVQQNHAPVKPVEAPPAFGHKSGQKPPVRPNQMPDLRRANSAIDDATLAQLRDVNQAAPQHAPTANDFPQPPYNNNPALVLPDRTAYSQHYDQYGQPYAAMPSQDMNPMPKRRGPPPPGNALPTIPGTPGVEYQNQFDMSPQRDRSANSISRKPVPSRSPSRQ